eukprot:2591481-Rhodomonas_salina.1
MRAAPVRLGPGCMRVGGLAREPSRSCDRRREREELRGVLEVCDLPVFDLLEALGVGCGLGGLHHVQVLVQVVLERIEHMRLDLVSEQHGATALVACTPEHKMQSADTRDAIKRKGTRA